MAAGSLLPTLGWVFGLIFAGLELSRRNILIVSPPASDSSAAEFVLSKNYRTAFHFQPDHNWMNDPNAPMYYEGYYHLFYQYNPDSALWVSNISWGHSVSTDLVHWTGLGIAFSPSKPFDISGCWSGSATFLPGNKPVILYTGLDTEGGGVQNVAYPKNLSDPFLREWIKPDYNPLIKPFEGVNASWFRDPSTAWVGQDGLWRILVGLKLGNDGYAILYKSKDFVTWDRAKDPLHYTNGSGMWECPDFFPLGEEGKYVLKISFFDNFYERYTVGRYDEERDLFVGDDPSSNDYNLWQRVDHGSFYASKTFVDVNKNRRIMWGWSNESDSKPDDVAKGWSGVQTIPRIVSLDASGKQLVQWPIEEIESLRGKHIHLSNVELEPGSLHELEGLTASQADIEVEFELTMSLNRAEPFDQNWLLDPPKLCRERGPSVHGGLGAFGLLVLASDNLEEHTAVYFRVFNTGGNYAVLMCTDQRKSSARNELYKPAFGGFVNVDMKKDGKISLRTLIDHSIVESFGGGGKTVITSRVYPTSLSKSSTHLYAFNNGTESVKISEFNGWNMAKAIIS
uniref:Cell wall invertase 1 n=1 Tax=Hemerocallis fulva TaxID=34190 RepID=A0A8E5I1E0_HEMFU|nr:cell wall invertase 1 [Hemerocallis fulva]